MRLLVLLAVGCLLLAGCGGDGDGVRTEPTSSSERAYATRYVTIERAAYRSARAANTRRRAIEGGVVDALRRLADRSGSAAPQVRAIAGETAAAYASLGRFRALFGAEPTPTQAQTKALAAGALKHLRAARAARVRLAAAARRGDADARAAAASETQLTRTNAQRRAALRRDAVADQQRVIETLKVLPIPADLPPVYAEHASFLTRRLSVSLAFLEALDGGGARRAMALAASLTDIERGYRSSLSALRARIAGLR